MNRLRNHSLKNSQRRYCAEISLDTLDTVIADVDIYYHRSKDDLDIETVYLQCIHAMSGSIIPRKWLEDRDYLALVEENILDQCRDDVDNNGDFSHKLWNDTDEDNVF